MNYIARIRSDFATKFGIPRQSGLAKDLKAEVIFEPEYRDPQALRGLEGFSHIWLIWEFSESIVAGWSPTVRPPRLGGNVHMGVFATRSPFRPNPIGLSCVRLESIELDTDRGPLLHVSGADLMDRTGIFDIKPYVPYADCITEALGGFAMTADATLDVDFPENLISMIPAELRAGLIEVLAQDPRPSYHKDPTHVYGFGFAGFDIRFRVSQGVVTVVEVVRL